MGDPYFKKPKGKTIDEIVAASRGNYWGCEHESALVRETSYTDENGNWHRGVVVLLYGHGLLRDEDLVQINPDEFIQTSVNGPCKRLGDTAVYKAARKRLGLPSTISNRKTKKESQNTETKARKKKKTDADKFHDAFFADRKKASD